MFFDNGSREYKGRTNYDQILLYHTVKHCQASCPLTNRNDYVPDSRQLAMTQMVLLSGTSHVCLIGCLNRAMYIDIDKKAIKYLF